MKINRKNVPKKVKENLQKGEVLFVLKCSFKRNVTTILSYHGAEVQTITKRGGREACVCDLLQPTHWWR
jgi:hypothetical protein